MSKKLLNRILITILIVIIFALCISLYIQFNTILDDLKRWKEGHQTFEFYGALWNLSFGNPVNRELLLFNVYNIICIILCCIGLKNNFNE